MAQHRVLIGAVVVSALLCPRGTKAQKTTGGIEGTITDPSGAVVPNAHVSATDETTGEKLATVSDQTGFYRFLELHPDPYLVVVEAAGFKQVSSAHVLVQISRVTSFSAAVTPGSATEQVMVSSGATGLDTVSTESGEVITAAQIEQLPIVGRAAMDLAQLSPGVQLRDGNDIDPTKNNFTIAAFQGRSGRETQIQMDGLSIQDHTVGGPVQNIGLDALQEFQVAQSTLNPAQSVASGGAVNMLTKSGSNQVHGSAFEFFRDSRLGARIGPLTSPYDRNQLGGSLGGAFLPNRLFYFADYELTDSRDSFYADTIFPSLNGFFGKPFREQFSIGRLDGVISQKWRGFARYSYSPNHGVVGYPSLGATYLDSLTNKTQAIVFGGGATYAGTHVTQSLSYGFNSYSERLLPNPGAPAPVDSKGRKYLIQIDGGSTLAYGVNWLSSQNEKQHNDEAKYDVDIQIGRHTLDFGINLTYWILGTDYPLRLNSPELDSNSFLGTGLTDPTQYPLVSISMGNALGYYTVPGALGFAHGAFPEWRPAGYIHDVWKATRNLTINAGLRYVFFSGQFAPGINHPALLDQFHPGLSGYRHAPKTNFGPQLGAAWDVAGNGKTVVRSAAGLYFEELTIDGFYGDPTNFIPAGISYQAQTVGSGGALLDPRSGIAFAAGDPLAAQYGFPDGTSGPALSPLFNETIGQASTSVINLNKLYIAASAQNTASTASSFDLSHALYSPSWPAGTKNPRVAQFNVAIERQLRNGLLFTGEYVLVHGYEFPLLQDDNHLGAANAASFDAGLATAAITAANASVGCPPGSAGVDCAIANGATIATYGAYGLGAGSAATGYAFRGVNPTFGTMNFYDHKGMNTYNGMNLRLDGKFAEPGMNAFRWINGNTVTFAYTLSRNKGNLRTGGTAAADVSATPSSWDSLQPNRFVGPDGLDRTSMLNAGTITDIKKGFVFSQITHWYSPLSNNPLLPTAFAGCGGGPEEIFCSDWTGDGTTNDVLPTAGPGAFGRSLKGASGLNAALMKYNTKFAGQPTPAGKLVVAQGLLTGAQLAQLSGVMPTLPLAPSNQVGLDLLLLTDVRLAWNYKVIGDRVTLSPSWDIFNVFNRSSYDAPANLLNGTLSGQPGTISGTIPSGRTNIRQRGSGTFEQGARRQMQAGLRISF